MVEFRFRMHCPLVSLWKMVRHRTMSFNLSSARYTAVEEGEFYVPDEWRRQAAQNKQASDGVIEREAGLELSRELAEHYDRSYRLYEAALAGGVAREQARLFLPRFAGCDTAVVKVDAAK